MSKIVASVMFITPILREITPFKVHFPDLEVCCDSISSSSLGTRVAVIGLRFLALVSVRGAWTRDEPLTERLR